MSAIDFVLAIGDWHCRETRKKGRQSNKEIDFPREPREMKWEKEDDSLYCGDRNWDWPVPVQIRPWV